MTGTVLDQPVRQAATVTSTAGAPTVTAPACVAGIAAEIAAKRAADVMRFRTCAADARASK